MPDLPSRTWFSECLRIVLLVLSLSLAGCGGGGGGSSGDIRSVQLPPVAGCELEDSKRWLLGYMQDQYLWYDRIPSVDASRHESIDSYFGALLYPGGGLDPATPDRWSFIEITASYEQFFGDGRVLGYGLAVAGLELRGHPEEALRIRYVEPNSPAASAGLQRGDVVLSLNGVSSSDMITRNDFSLLTPKAVGDALELRIRAASGERTVSVIANVFDLMPVSPASVLRTHAGRTLGYLLVKDFINQANPQFELAFAQFKSAGVTELVLDLRYNGGGLVTVARDLASFIGGSQSSGDAFVTLKFNDKQQKQNSTYAFALPSSRLDLTRVFILSGQRTCSASELLINGLKPFVTVVQIGDTTCGKPVGFIPASRCGTTFNAVNFEVFNALDVGRYWDGLAPSCRVADEFVLPLGNLDESLLAAARQYADTGACPVAGQAGRTRSPRMPGDILTEPGERQGMWLR